MTHAPIATITLNRPEHLNTIVPPMPDEIEAGTAATDGVRAAVGRRDGPWGDYSQAPPGRRPDPSHVIEP